MGRFPIALTSIKQLPGQSAGRRPEHEATETNRYKTLDGALACLINDFNVAGIEVPPEQMGLF